MALSRLFRHYLGFSLAILITVLISAVPTKAEVPFYWDAIKVEIDVQQNSDMWITETQKYVFTGNYTNERYRYIPLDKVDRITDVTVTEKGKRLPTLIGTEHNQLWIRWQHGLNPPESHTFVVKYRVIGGVQVHNQRAEVYWKAIFPDRQALVQTGRVTVRLPPALAGKILTYQAYGIPSSGRTLDDRTIEFVADQALPPGQKLEVLVRFPNSVLNFAQPHWQRFYFFRFGFQFISQNFSTFIVAFIWLTFSGSIVRSLLLAKRCPQCRKFTLDRSTSTLEMPTPLREGRWHVVEHCTVCAYHREFDQVIPYSSGGGSGSDSGGGGGGDGGGGGGG